MKNLYPIIILTLSLNLQVLGKTLTPFAKDNPIKKGINLVKNSSNLVVDSSKKERFNIDKLTLVTRNSSSLETLSSHQGWLFYPTTSEGETPEEDINTANSTIDAINNSGNYTSFLSADDLLHLPVGIKSVNAKDEADGLSYMIGIANAEFHKDYAILEAYFVFEVPQAGKKIAFGAKDIKFNLKNGFISGKLQLLTDFEISVSGNKSKLVLNGGYTDNATYASFDCEGFTEMNIDADLQFGRNWIIPVDSEGKHLEFPARVETHVRTNIESWNDLLVEVNIPSFKIKGYNEATFDIKNAVFDFSDARNSALTKFPDGYLENSGQVIPGFETSWRGVYMDAITVTMSKAFNKKSGERTQFGAYGFLIDDNGFTGQVIARNILDLEQGDMNGWKFSINEIALNFESNNLTKGEFLGDIVLPVNKKDQELKYEALVSDVGEYIFKINTIDTMRFEMFSAAKVELLKTSYIDVKLVDDRFYALASLDGSMDIVVKQDVSKNQKTDKDYAKLAGVEFQKLVVANHKPYFSVEAFSGGIAGKQQIGGFPLFVENINVYGNANTVGLKVGVGVALVGEESGGFTAKTNLDFISKLKVDDSGTQNWKFSGLNVDKASIDIEQGAYSFYGSIDIYKDDPLYGNAFAGNIEAEFKPKLEIGAKAMFGTKDGFRYWYVDALATLPTGIPIFAGLEINGFGGGAYYHMQPSSIANTNRTELSSPSSISYVPDRTKGLGLKASVAMQSQGNDKTFNGQATFEMNFHESGGLSYIGFYGYAQFITAPIEINTGKLADNINKSTDIDITSFKIQKDPKQVVSDEKEAKLGKNNSINASIDLNYNFDSDELHGTMDAYVNIAGGTIKGTQANGLAGKAEMYAGNGEWYIYIGTPDTRIGLSLGVGDFKLQTTSYFMAGTKVKDSPPPPSNVSKILGLAEYKLDYMRDLNALGDGRGFAFGSDLNVDTGDIKMAIFYARFQAGLGFDIMLKDYNGATCSGTNELIGVNGWYANGQMYGYFDGDIGIKVRMFTINKNIKILNIGAAALLQAKLPNPFWMRGTVGGYYNILGGAVKGTCNFEVTIGEECNINKGSALEGEGIIASMTPNDGSTDVNVFAEPQVVFNYAVGKPFTILEADNTKKTYKIELEQLVLKTDKGKVIDAEQIWNDDHTVIVYKTIDILPSKAKLKLDVKISLKEKQGNSWKKLVVNGKTLDKSKSLEFISGVAPDFIPENNIAYSYPLKGMQNFYPKEFSKGYIKLDKGQDELFAADAKWKQEVHFVSEDGEIIKSTLGYDDKQVDFNLPRGFSKQAQYEMRLVNVPAQDNSAIDANVEKTEKEIETSGESETIVTTQKAEGTLEQLEEKVLYAMNLRSSKYETFGAKIDAAKYEYNFYKDYLYDGENRYMGLKEIGSGYSTDEYFDEIELYKDEPMIVFEESLNNSWFEDKINPYMYKLAKELNFEHRFRSTDKMGYIPIKNVISLDQNYSKFRLSDRINWEAKEDYIDFINQAATLWVNTQNKKARKILDMERVPDYYKEVYPVKVNYILPGIGLSSSKVLEINNN